MLKRIPPQIRLPSRYSYVVASALILLAALLLLNQDRHLSGVDVALIAGLAAILALIWQRGHPRIDSGMLAAEGDVLRDIKRSGQFSLLAFESEYCAMCLVAGPRIEQLEKVDGLNVYRLSVNSEPGQSLFRQVDGRLTPTYILVDPHGNYVQEWILVLPIERILYAVRQQPAA